MRNDKRSLIPLTPILATQGAALLLGTRDGSPQVLAMRTMAGLVAKEPWAAAFVQWVGYRTHLNWASHRSSWQLPPAGSFETMRQFARSRGVLTLVPAHGDIALYCDRDTGAYLQGGFVAHVKRAARMGNGGPDFYDCTTVEGNTDLFGRLHGPEVCRLSRSFVPEWGDCFIRWAELDARGVSGTPWEQTEQVSHVPIAKAA